MRIYADLHIHSRYSRATSADLDLPHLAIWARRKGITVLGTGDFTHPGWMAELKAGLLPAEPGLYRLRDDIERAASAQVEPSCRGDVRFMLSVEISTIYKKGDRTRKIHHLVYVPDFEAAERLTKALARIGNLNADGRPILGLDSRHLLEAVLDSGAGSYLVPAHIWTPWFSVLGSKAGFDAVEECYGDLAPHIFALETGLSSDPEMNWRISSLDRYRLVSSSDAHSPQKLGREATAFDVPLNYFAIRNALETGEGFLGTVEFFPEEGKYHLDGHRKCGIRFTPEETRARGEVCPVCKHPLTVGVLSRVEALADRAVAQRPASAGDFRHLIPLPEVLSELAGTGPDSQAVQKTYGNLLSRLGPELYILEQAPVEDIRGRGPALLDEAVARMREGRVIRDSGYDGEYGVIRLFSPDELHGRKAARGLFEEPSRGATRKTKKQEPSIEPLPSPLLPVAPPAPTPPPSGSPAPQIPQHTSLLAALDPDQRAAAEITEGALLIIAGPGTGKTRTLTHRIAHLIAHKNVPPEACLAITFTRRAADELKERLESLLGEAAALVPTMTFHALALSILREASDAGLTKARSVADEPTRIALLAAALGVPERRAESLLASIGRLKRRGHRHADAPEQERAFQAYERALEDNALCDFDDLVGSAIDVLTANPQALALQKTRYRAISIDEYQDIDERQVQILKLVAGEGTSVCAIGDPDQAIYGFRGADVRLFLRFQDDFPGARLVRITRNYRSARPILDGALRVIASSPTIGERALIPLAPGTDLMILHEARTERAEAEYIVHSIERMIGGSSFFSMDSGRVGARDQNARTMDLAFSDFAVLYRTDSQSRALAEAFARSGMPFQRRSHASLGAREAVHALTRALLSTPSRGPLTARLKEASTKLREEHARPSEPEASSAEGAPLSLGEADIDAALELLLPLGKRADHDVGRFLQELSTSAEIDTWDPRAHKVSLLTLHASKGLEFRVVFLVGCEDGLLPLRFGRSDETSIDEERRLFYVGMTRAKERLFLTRAKERARHGTAVSTDLSPFVREIEDRIDREEAPGERRPAEAKRQLKLF